MAQNRVRESAVLDWAGNTASDAVMVRRQVYLKPRQDLQIKHLAAERSTTEADVIREAIDMLLSEVTRQKRAQKAWDETLAFMEERYAQGAVSGGRTWTRDELYEERLSRRYG
jgi:tRNA-dihydrouridine synthase